MRFLPGLWADSRRSFPSTQLAFSIWVPGPLLTPYSQNTFSSHRNPSNSQHIRAAQLMASLSAQPPRMSARITDITGLDKPICPTARMSARITGITGRDKPICPTARMSARETGITGLDKPICPTARTHLAPNGYSQTEYHRPLLPKKQTPNKTVSRQFCPASVYACSLFRNFHTVFEFAAFGNGFRQFVKVAVLKLYFFKGTMLQIQFFEYTPVEYHICQHHIGKLQM